MTGKEIEAHEFLLQTPGIPKPFPCSREMLQRHVGFRYADSLVFNNPREKMQLQSLLPWSKRLGFYSKQNSLLRRKYEELHHEKRHPKVSIRWIDGRIGYGLFTEEPLNEGAYLGEYCGLIFESTPQEVRGKGYCFHYPTRLGALSFWVIDAEKIGGLTRFVNHSDTPNLKMECMVIDRLQHFILVSDRPINAHEELRWDYGLDYWMIRRKLFS